MHIIDTGTNMHTSDTVPMNDEDPCATNPSAHFENYEEIAHGAYSRIYISSKDASVVIKTCDREDLLHREVAILSRLEHPNIIKHLAFDPTRRCIVLENGGVSMYDVVLGKERVPYDMTQLVSAVVHMHERKVVHRDIKLENIVYNHPTNALKLIDFGLSHAYNDAEDEGCLTRRVGTHTYAAPEIFHDRPYNGFKVDIWSLGVVFFACYAYYFPFNIARETDYRFRNIQKVQSTKQCTCDALYNMYGNRCLMHPRLKCLINKMLCIDARSRASIGEIDEYIRS